MSRELFFDVETFSTIPLKNGLHAYAEEVEVMLVQYAIDDTLLGEEGEVHVIDLTAGEELPQELLDALDDPEVPIIIQNSQFDRTVVRHDLGIDVPVERIEDTMVQALSHGLPGALDKLCDVFDVPSEEKKHGEGKALINLFCKPRPANAVLRRATRATHPAEWQRFKDYAASDIRAMRYIRRQMPRWNYPGKPKGNQRFAPERELWLLDQKINDRGFKADVELATHAVKMVERHKKTLAKRVNDLTDGEVEAATQRDKLLVHLLEWYGVTLPDMKKSTLERRLQDENLPDPVRELIAIRLDASGTSQAKYERVLSGVSNDGRLRGTLAFCGAARTGRWAGRLFQPQNMPRPNMKSDEIDAAIAEIKGGDGDLFLDDPMRAASNAIRGTIIAEEGRKLCIADLSNIEGRVLAWLADEDWKLDAFFRYDTLIFNPDGSKKMIRNSDGKMVQAREGPDLYHVTAGAILGKKPEDVTPDERQTTGKVPELACGYQGAAGAFATMAALYGLDLGEDAIVKIVGDWRRQNGNIRDLWYRAEEAAMEAVRQPGVMTYAGRLSFHCTGAWLRMKLPSGRLLCYAYPRIEPDDKFNGRIGLVYTGINSYTRQWSDIRTYGGKLIENATQACARDVMGHNMQAIEEAGFPIVLTVHDEVITEPLDSDEFSVARLERLLANRPDWADDRLPLAAGGFETYRYRKG